MSNPRLLKPKSRFLPFVLPWSPFTNLAFCIFLSLHSWQDLVAESPPLQFLQNDHLKVGVAMDSGGAIAWISTAKSEENWINHYDRGRLVQQSYYGDADGSDWNHRPWRWNAVQGGDWRGASAKVLEAKVESDAIYVRSHPKHWATGEDLTEAIMEQSLRLQQQVLHVHYRFEYRGTKRHAPHHQEVPALFFPPQCSTLVIYSGDKPWSDAPIREVTPGSKNEYYSITEHWAAYFNEDKIGLGAYVPKADQLTCYRFRDPHSDISACSYFAPIVTFGLEPGLVWEYDVYLTIGNLGEIRTRFKSLHTTAKAR